MTARVPSPLPVYRLVDYGLNPRAPEAIDSSMLKDFMDCPSMFYLRHVLGLRRKRRSVADIAKFDWGTCWHGLQECYWNARIAEKPEPHIIALEWLGKNFPEGIRPDTDRHKRGKERMIKMFFEYWETKVPLLDDEYETLRTEQFFDVFDEEFGIRWAGRIDKVRRRRRNGKKVIWDYKTTSAMSDTYFQGHEHGFQLPGYVWAASKMDTEPLDEVVLDVLYSLAASHQFFIRPFRYTPQRLAEWRSNVGRILETMHYLLAHELENPDAWVKNWNECNRYGLCQFSDVHFLAPIRDTRLRVLEGDYIEERWDPCNHVDEAVS